MQANATKVLKATHGRIQSLFHRSGLSIRLRLIVCFVSIVLLMIAVRAVAVWQYWQMEAPAQRVSRTDQISHAVERVHLDVDTFRDSMAALGSSHDTRQFTGEAAAIRQKFLEHVDDAEQMLRATPQFEQEAPISSALESLRVATWFFVGCFCVNQLRREAAVSPAGFGSPEISEILGGLLRCRMETGRMQFPRIRERTRDLRTLFFGSCWE